jgi:Holliday junction DNA helicase RuvA
MIAFLDGNLEETMPTRVVVSAGGVGYEVFIPLSTYERLPAIANRVKLLTYLAIRENEHVLYGFLTRDERDLFALLVNHVSGIGPKIALTLLSGCAPQQFKSAVLAGDTSFLTGIKGIGKKTAERIVVELKDRLAMEKQWMPLPGAVTSDPDAVRSHDAVMALMALGYKQPDALRAVEKAGRQETVEELVREALKVF